MVENRGKLFLVGPRAPKTDVPALTDVLDGIERLAAERGPIGARAHPGAGRGRALQRPAPGTRVLGAIAGPAPAAQLTSALVDEALEAVVRTEYSGYARIWAGLTRAQKVALKAVIEERDLIRLDLDGEERSWRIEDPFLASWLRLAQAASTH